MVKETHYTDIESAAAEAVRVISAAAAEAARVVANAASEAVKVANVKGSEDHDLLIEMRTRLERLSEDIRELKDGTSKRIQDLENYKANKKDFEELKNDVYVNIESRIRCLENKTANYTITLSLFVVAVTSLIGLVIYHILQ